LYERCYRSRRTVSAYFTITELTLRFSFGFQLAELFPYFLFRMPSTTVVTTAKQIHAGDQISWPTQAYSGIFSHHVIVVAPQGGTKFKVIHARFKDCGIVQSSGFGTEDSHVVAEDIIDLKEDISKKVVVLYEYEPSECSEPFEVIQNARSKLGKFEYDARNNNCEHFARWCKTGNKISVQAIVAEDVALAVSAAAVSSLLQILKPK